MTKLLPVKCPTCDKKFNYYGSEFRPFCCERCQQIDLGNWADGTYSVAGRPASPEEITEELIQDQLSEATSKKREY